MARSRPKLGSDPNHDHRRDPPASRPNKRTRLHQIIAAKTRVRALENGRFAGRTLILAPHKVQIAARGADACSACPIDRPAAVAGGEPRAVAREGGPAWFA